MGEIETDYLVVGAGASGMAFVDALITADPSAEVLMVDRQHRPGGHWLNAYPFVRLHQPSANYGVTSRPLGHDCIDQSGPNAGFYERATAPEICDYFNRVMDDDFVASGRVRFLAMSDYRGEAGGAHSVESLLTGSTATVEVRKKFVDATYVESSIPARHTPGFVVDDGVRFVPPNDLVDLAESSSGYTVIGSGKTAMDTCVWLLDQGVAPDAIRWIRPRDVWSFERSLMQPLELVGSFMQLQAGWIAAAAEATDAGDFMHRLEDDGIFVRIDPSTEPDVFRGPIISAGELESLRRIENVVRSGKVRRITTTSVEMDDSSLVSEPRHVHVDCTAPGIRTPSQRPIFEPGRITLQYVTLGVVPWSMATIGTVEALRDDDNEKNRLCPSLAFSPSASDILKTAHAGISGLLARGAEPDLAAWNERCRLNPGRGALDHLDDPRVGAALTAMGTNIGPAMNNLGRLVGADSDRPAG